MARFDMITRALQKKGKGLTEEEEYGLRAFIRDHSVSPGFVRRVVCDYGDESITSAFGAPNVDEADVLEILLRRYKGHFYRKRYPAMAVV